MLQVRPAGAYSTCFRPLRAKARRRRSLRRCDIPITIGLDIDEAVELVMSLGPAGEILRLAGEQAAHLHEPVAEALRDGLADWAGPDGVIAPASTWIVTANAPS